MSAFQSLEFKKLAEELAETGRFLAHKNWSPATSSNYSARLTEPNHHQYVLSRSGVDKHQMTADDFLLVDSQGALLAPAGEKPSAETLIHCAIYQNFPMASCVLHTHSVFATRLSLKHFKKEKIEFSNYEILKGLAGNTTHLMSEIVPILPNTQDMKEFVTWLNPLLQNGPHLHGFLISGHGLYTWGATIQETRRHVETFEFLFEAQAYSEMGF